MVVGVVRCAPDNMEIYAILKTNAIPDRAFIAICRGGMGPE